MVEVGEVVVDMDMTEGKSSIAYQYPVKVEGIILYLFPVTGAPNTTEMQMADTMIVDITPKKGTKVRKVTTPNTVIAKGTKGIITRRGRKVITGTRVDRRRDTSQEGSITGDDITGAKRPKGHDTGRKVTTKKDIRRKGFTTCITRKSMESRARSMTIITVKVVQSWKEDKERGYRYDKILSSSNMPYLL